MFAALDVPGGGKPKTRGRKSKSVQGILSGLGPRKQIEATVDALYLLGDNGSDYADDEFDLIWRSLFEQQDKAGR